MNICFTKDAFVQGGRMDLWRMMLMIVCFGMSIFLLGDCNALLKPREHMCCAYHHLFGVK